VKSALLSLAALAALGGIFAIASPASASALVHRVVGFLDPVPQIAAEPEASGAGGAYTTALAPSAGAPEWRVVDREAAKAYEVGEFAAAVVGWNAAIAKAPPLDQQRLRARADRANVFLLMSEGAPAAPDADPKKDEAEYRRRIEGLKAPSAGAYLEIADFAASHGLRRHLAFLYEQAFERKAQTGNDEVQQKVSRIVRERKTARSTPGKDVLESVIRELPTSEAADIAREETGASSGIGSVSERGQGTGKAEDPTTLAEARRLMQEGDAEYRKALPGTKDVNVHRRAALNAYTKSRELFEQIDRETGMQCHPTELRDLLRDIAELHKDLPIGK
jgi:hypothetical protein